MTLMEKGFGGGKRGPRGRRRGCEGEGTIVRDGGDGKHTARQRGVGGVGEALLLHEDLLTKQVE